MSDWWALRWENHGSYSPVACAELERLPCIFSSGGRHTSYEGRSYDKHIYLEFQLGSEISNNIDENADELGGQFHRVGKK